MLRCIDVILGRLMADLQQRFYYRIPRKKDQAWFQQQYTEADIVTMAASLKTLYLQDGVEQQVLMNELMQVLFKALFNRAVDVSAIEARSLTYAIEALPVAKHNDYLVCAIIIALVSADHYQKRAKLLLNLQESFNLDPTIWMIFYDLAHDRLQHIHRPAVLGEGLQNKQARLNGMREYGWFHYRQQMRSMQKGVEIMDVKQRFSFLNDLTSDTLGGRLCQILRQQKLTLPGEPHGFAAFFLWHDLGHVLSGNGTNYPGELGANAFTAGCAEYAKFKILIWGLLEFNCGFDLAVVATPSKNHLTKPVVMQQYVHSLLSGSGSRLNILDWPTVQMLDDLAQPLEQVRQKYGIKIFMQ